MANNRIQIKRSTANATVTGLNPGELAFTAAGDVLYIGNPADGASKRIGGLQVPGTLTANQALVANATSGIDKVITANLVPTSIWANGSSGSAGQVLATNATAVYWTTPTAGVAGSDTQVQFNDGGLLAGDAGLTYNKTTDILTVSNNVLVGSTVNAASHTVGSSTIANATGVFTTGTVNGATLSVGTSVVANSSRLVIGTAVGVQANGSIGSAGQVLTSNATTVYWSTPTTGTVTSVDSGNGLTGGPITSSGTLAVGAGNGISVSADAVAILANSGLIANATGLHVVAGNSGVISNTSGVFVNAATFSIATSQLSGDVALGTQTSGNYVATITAGAGISGSGTGEGSTPTIAVVANNGITSNTSGVFVTQGTGTVVNATGVHVNSSYIGTLSANNATYLNGQLAAYYTNASNITTGTLPWAQAPSGTVNTSGSFTLGGVTTFNANIVLGSSGLSSNGSFGTSGQVLHSNGTATYWAADDGVTSVDSGNGLTGGPITSTGTLAVGAGNGISVSADAVAVSGGSTLTVNSTGAHVNTTLSITDLTLAGNLIINGTLTTVNTTNLSVTDPLIKLANGNSTTDSLDIGFYGVYGNATNTSYTGLFRDASDSGLYKLYTGLSLEPTTTVDTTNTSFTIATLQSFIRSGGLTTNSTAANLIANSTYAVGIVANSLTLSTPLAGTSGGTGRASWTSQDILVANSSNGINALSVGTGGYVLSVSTSGIVVWDYLDGGTF